MSPRNLFNLLLFAAFTAVCVAGTVYVAANMGLALPGVHEMHLSADFAAAEGVVPQDAVAISGVKVGRVLQLSPAPGGGTRVLMAIDTPDLVIPAGTRAVVRPKSLLGEQEIELIRPASSNATPLSDGAVIPVAQTGQAVQIDDALNAMDAPTRAAMSVDLQQLGAAVSSRASDVNNSVPSLDQTVTDLRPLAQLAERRQQQVDRILSDVNTIMLALSDEEQQLGQVVDSGNTFFGAISTRDREFGTTLQQLNQLFGSLDSSLQGTTPAQRQALADAPATLAASQKMLSYLNPDVDRIIPEVLQAQVSYPSNQLNYAHPNAVTLAQEWESDFSQSDANGDAQRVTNITCTPLTCTSGNQSSTGPPAITMTQPTLIAGDPGLLLLDLLGGAS